ncbi:MAG: hypothetical protein M0Z78_01850 [Betaproteobacteria bacterium]|jgi:hypothetical protein|nr:hypothetical protein [Betaproteobacteria bacterium]
MAALYQQYLFDSECQDAEEGLASIRDARLEVEAEAHAQLEEQARWRLAAQARAVPVDQLHQSRLEDLQRLEEQRRQAEREAIDAIEQRMEVALRAIEADNDRIIEEERATMLATERLRLAKEAMQQARDRQELEQRLAEKIRQRQSLEREAGLAAKVRIEAEQELMQLAQERRLREEQCKQTADGAGRETLEYLSLLDYERAQQCLMHRNRWLVGMLGVTWAVAAVALWRVYVTF